MGITVTNPTDYADTPEGKMALLCNYLFPLICEPGKTVDECIEISEDGTMYIYVKWVNESLVTMYAKPNSINDYVETREKVVISEGIQELGDNILEENTVKDIYLPKTLSSPTSYISLGNARIHQIRTRLTQEDLQAIHRKYYNEGWDIHKFYWESDVFRSGISLSKIQTSN